MFIPSSRFLCACLAALLSCAAPLCAQSESRVPADAQRALPQKAEAPAQAAPGFLRAMPNSPLKPYFPNAAAFFRILPQSAAQRFEILPNPDGTYTVMAVLPLETQSVDDNPFSDVTLQDAFTFQAQPVRLPTGMPARIVAAMRRAVAAAQPGLAAARLSMGTPSHFRPGTRMASRRTYVFAVRAPDGSYHVAKTVAPAAYNPARLVKIFALIRCLPLPPDLEADTFAQVDGLLTALESGQNTP